MKKIVLALAVIATVACFSSCNKVCTCKTYVAGVVTLTNEVELDRDTYSKCSDLNKILVENPKTGVECTL
ncbi:MAG: hypothetical protein MJZ77_03725 [Bacteroidales bacterium]|nr:hypothetical protein [Bacteroidales bacterium]